MHPLRHLYCSYATCAEVTPLVQHIRNLCCSYVNFAAIALLVLQLHHICYSYATCTAATPLSCEIILIFTLLKHNAMQRHYDQLRHLSSSYATCGVVTPLVQNILIFTLLKLLCKAEALGKRKTFFEVAYKKHCGICVYIMYI